MRDHEVARARVCRNGLQELLPQPLSSGYPRGVAVPAAPAERDKLDVVSKGLADSLSKERSRFDPFCVRREGAMHQSDHREIHGELRE